MNDNILLINLPISTWYKKMFAETNSMPPLGMLYVGTMLKNNGFHVNVIDLAVESFSMESLKKKIIDADAKIVGLSTYNESWYSQIQLCNIIKSIDKDIKIFAGGAFATFCYESVLKESATDFVVTSEGEFSTLAICKEILEDKDTYSTLGVIWKDKNGNIVKNADNPRIKDLDSIIWPDRNLLDLSKYTMPFTISTARGCPGECIFCSSKAFWGKCVYMRSAQSVYDEIMHLHNSFRANVFYIADDTFTASRRRAFDTCKMLKESGVKWTWGCESRADVVDDELISTLKESGCTKIQFGLESADNDILKSLKKKVTIEQIENAIKIAYKYHMHITASFIIGHAADTRETIKKTINFAEYIQNEYGVNVVGSINTPFPGTEQYNKAQELGIEILSDDWNCFRLNNAIINTKNLTVNDLRTYYNRVLMLQMQNRN
ncbi:B12-binding domain-containing radical SAM protein [Lachnotalea glycerini]|uniref:Radical SAM protein n=1 Tax=Lachnotalea glycerini TaxID=1763509 RepID=A0A371JBB8_9FIRM|nr:radical SAM protein [Lachnotalea glycerini]RDY30013.1 radical SAM protein [Lachnotalea glycerini]